MLNHFDVQLFRLLFFIPLIITSCGAIDAKISTKSSKAKKDAEEADRAWSAAKKAQADADKARAEADKAQSDANKAKADLAKAETNKKIADIKNGIADKPDVIDDPFNPRFMPDPDLPKKVADEIERRRIEAQKNRRPPIGAGVPNAGGIPLDPRTGKPQPGVSLLPTEPRKQKTPEEIAKEQNSYLLKNHQNMQVRNLAEKLEDLGHETYHNPRTLAIVVTDPFNNYSFYKLKEKNEKSLLDALKQAYKKISGFDPD